MNLHILGIPNTVTKKDFFSCEYTQSIYNFISMFADFNFFDDIFHYGHPDSSLPEDVVNIKVIDDDLLMRTYGYYSGTTVLPKFYASDNNDKAHIEFNNKAIREIKRTVDSNDIVIFPKGRNHQMIYRSLIPLQDMQEIACVEYNIKYTHSTVDYFKCFQSSLDRTVENSQIKEHFLHMKDRIIEWGPDPNEYNYTENKENYFLYVGKIVEEEGIDLAIQLANMKNVTLKIIPEYGNLTHLGYELDDFSDNIQLIDHEIDFWEKKSLIESAKGVILPRFNYDYSSLPIYESLFSGTPVITCDWGRSLDIIDNGINGYRCNTFKDYCDAIDKIEEIDMNSFYKNNITKYTFEVIKQKYIEYFSYVNNAINGGGFYHGI